MILLFSSSSEKDWERIDKPVFTKSDELICRQFFYLLMARNAVRIK